MNLGYFDDDNKEYVITTPRTPLPWINYLGCESFFRLISNTGGGYAFYKDAKLLRLTRYRYNNAPLDSNGHYFYINDNGCIWNPGWQPVQTELDSYECRHGLGYTTYKGSKNGIEAHVASFVPIGANCELTRLSLNNTSDKSKTFSVYSYIEFCLWNAVDDMNNFQRTYSTGEVEIEPYKANSCIYHKTEYRERRNHYALCAMNSSCDGFDTDRDSFLGTYGSPQMPDAVAAKTSHNSKASGWNPVASFRKDITLKPNEKCHFQKAAVPVPRRIRRLFPEFYYVSPPEAFPQIPRRTPFSVPPQFPPLWHPPSHSSYSPQSFPKTWYFPGGHTPSTAGRMQKEADTPLPPPEFPLLRIKSRFPPSPAQWQADTLTGLSFPPRRLPPAQ